MTKRALYVLTVKKPNVDTRMCVNFNNYDAADDASRAFIMLGYDVKWEKHGYTLYNNAEDAIEAAKWFN